MGSPQATIGYTLGSAIVAGPVAKEKVLVWLALGSALGNTFRHLGLPALHQASTPHPQRALPIEAH